MASGESNPPFEVHPSLEIFLATPSAFLARHFAHDDDSHRPLPPRNLCTGAIVFDRPLDVVSPSGAGPPRVLLVQRAPTDSMPLLWETPGGGCDSDDVSVLHACARELREEAGLETAAVRSLVRCVSSDTEVVFKGGPAEGEPEWGERMGSHMFLTRGMRLMAKFYFVMEPKQPSEVVLDPNEHTAYVWATEQEVRDCRMQSVEENEEPGLELKFTTKKQRQVVLESFKLWGNTAVDV